MGRTNGDIDDSPPTRGEIIAGIIIVSIYIVSALVLLTYAYAHMGVQ